MLVMFCRYVTHFTPCKVFLWVTFGGQKMHRSGSVYSQILGHNMGHMMSGIMGGKMGHVMNHFMRHITVREIFHIVETPMCIWCYSHIMGQFDHTYAGICQFLGPNLKLLFHLSDSRRSMLEVIPTTATTNNSQFGNYWVRKVSSQKVNPCSCWILGLFQSSNPHFS